MGPIHLKTSFDFNTSEFPHTDKTPAPQHQLIAAHISTCSAPGTVRGMCLLKPCGTRSHAGGAACWCWDCNVVCTWSGAGRAGAGIRATKHGKDQVLVMLSIQGFAVSASLQGCQRHRTRASACLRVELLPGQLKQRPQTWSPHPTRESASFLLKAPPLVHKNSITG